MTTYTPRLGLPFIEAAQAQKHVTHNAALERLDTIVQLQVQQFGATTPPASPQEGQSWALGTDPTGIWAGQNARIATFSGGGWIYFIPRPGWRAWGVAENILRVWTATGWANVGLGLNDIDTLPKLGLNASADTTNRLTVAAPATLFNHAGGGHQVKVNKASAAATASLLYQTGFSGRAEMGLAGNDDFSIKVSANGGTWTEALRIDAATGAVSLPRTPARRPALCQLRNADTTTDLATAAFATVPMNGIVDLRDTATFALSGQGVQCLVAGRVRVCGQVTGDGGTNQRVAFDLSIAVNGVRLPGIGQSSYSRGVSNHRTGTSAITRWVDVAAGDVITLQSRRAGDVGTMVMLAGESLLIVEHYA